MNITDFGLLDVTHLSNIPQNIMDSAHNTNQTNLLTNTNSSTTLCPSIPSLTRLEEFYAPIHAYLATAICFFGTTTNLLNAIVLTQKQMRNTTNAILTAIALVDSLTMISSGFHAIYLNFATSPYPENYPHSYAAIQMILFQNVITIGSHTISTGLLVQLAGFRCWILYSANVKPKTSYGVGSYHSHNSKQKHCVTLGIVIICFIGIMLSMPTFFIYTIHKLDLPEHTNHTEGQPYYWFKVRDGAERWEHAHFVLYGCFVKILASILIFILTCFILIAMRTARRRYAKLRSLSSVQNRTRLNPKSKGCLIPNIKSSVKQSNHHQQQSNDSKNSKSNDHILTRPELNNTNYEPEATQVDNLANDNNNNNNKPVQQPTNKLSQKNRDSQHVTIMLIVVVVSFVITEAPQGVLGTLVAIRGECFHNTVYVPLGDLLDLLVLLNSSINFILYCAMSQLFRQNFTHLVKRTCSCLFCTNRQQGEGEEEELQAQHTIACAHRPSAVPVKM